MTEQLAQAARELHMTTITLVELLKREKLPIGYAVKLPGKSRHQYVIYRQLLDEYRKKVIGE